MSTSMLISAATALTRWPERKDFKQTVLLDAAEADAIGADLTTAPIAATPAVVLISAAITLTCCCF